MECEVCKRERYVIFDQRCTSCTPCNRIPLKLFSLYIRFKCKEDPRKIIAQVYKFEAECEDPWIKKFAADCLMDLGYEKLAKSA